MVVNNKPCASDVQWSIAYMIHTDRHAAAVMSTVSSTHAGTDGLDIQRTGAQ